MFAALLGLSPTVIAILAAVCSPRLGLCALHGQMLYFAGLLLYSPLPLSINSLWLVPFFSCLLFFAGCVMGVFMVRPDINPQSERGSTIATMLLVLVNFILLLILLHSVFNMMCFRLNDALALPAVERFTLILQLGLGGLFIWLLLWLFKGRARLACSAFYAALGLLFSTYFILISSADKVTWAMPLRLQRALSLRGSVEYFTIASTADFAPVLYLIPPFMALLCALAGSLLLRESGERMRIFSR